MRQAAHSRTGVHWGLLFFSSLKYRFWCQLTLEFNQFYLNPPLAFRGFCRASKYPLPLLVAANAGVYIASIWEGNLARDNGSVNSRLYNVYHMALKCAFQKCLGIV